MKKKILGIFAGFLVLAMLTGPVIAKPTQTPIEYFREVENVISVIGGTAGKSSVYHIKVSERTGSIYEGTDNTGEKLFTFTQWGSCMMRMGEQSKSVWHIDMIWESTTADGGFKGKLNGLNPLTGAYTVSGVLNGYGEFNGQKLTIEMTREPQTYAYITGYLQAP